VGQGNAPVVQGRCVENNAPVISSASLSVQITISLCLPLSLSSADSAVVSLSLSLSLSLCRFSCRHCLSLSLSEKKDIFFFSLSPPLLAHLLFSVVELPSAGLIRMARSVHSSARENNPILIKITLTLLHNRLTEKSERNRLQVISARLEHTVKRYIQPNF